METYLTIPQVANRLQCSIHTVRRYIDSGKLAAVKMGWLWRIRESDLEKYMTPQERKG